MSWRTTVPDSERFAEDHPQAAKTLDTLEELAPVMTLEELAQILAQEGLTPIMPLDDPAKEEVGNLLRLGLMEGLIAPAEASEINAVMAGHLKKVSATLVEYSGPRFIIMPPKQAQEGESGHGFIAGQRVRVLNDQHFTGWHGHVRTFDIHSVAVDLDEPPPGHRPNGQWFRPDQLEKV